MSRLLFFLGVGVVIGILIAPEKGAVIRKKIIDLIDDLSEAGHHLAEPVEAGQMPADPANL
jgi:hypothetical protein